MLDRVIYQIFAQECHREPSASFDTILSRARARLESISLPIDKLLSGTRVEELKDSFVPRLVPNPSYWKNIMGQRLGLYLLHAKANRYHRLLRLLSEIPGLSYYVCYGTIDVILRVFGTEKELRRIERYLEENGFSPVTLLVEDVIIFYAHDVKQERPSPLKKEDLQRIDAILSKRADEIEPDMITKLQRQGVILGTVYLEDHRLTGRTRAFIGVQITEMLTATQRRGIEKQMRDINPQELALNQSPPLTTLYRCNDPYPYVLQLIVDDHAQLDRVTDRLQDLHEAIGDTVTFVVAKNHEQPILLTRTTHEHAEKYLVAKEILDQELAPLTDDFTRTAPSAVIQLFQSQTPERQLSALTLYRELAAKPEMESKGPVNEVAPYLFDLLQGVLDEEQRTIRNAGFSLIRDLVEARHLAMAKQITDSIFQGEDNLWQKELRQSNANWRKWGLRVWADQVYPSWNRHLLFGTILQVPDNILENLRFLGATRNDFAHVREPVADIRTLVRRVRQVFYYAVDFLEWLESVQHQIDRPHLRLQDVQSLLLQKHEGVTMDILQLAKDIKGLQLDTLKDLSSYQLEDEQRWNWLAKRLNLLVRENKRADEELFDAFEELVLPRLPEKEKGHMAMVLNLVRNSAENFPSDFVASILSAMMLSAIG